VDGEDPGTLCAYGPTSDPQPEYVIHCFNGAVSGQVVTIKNTFTGSLKLCNVQVLGKCSFFFTVCFFSLLVVWCTQLKNQIIIVF